LVLTGRSEEVVGAAGVATAGEALRGISRERVRELDGDRVLSLPGRKVYPGGEASAHSGWNAGELGLGREDRQKG
jgi:hypothetical protein